MTGPKGDTDMTEEEDLLDLLVGNDDVAEGDEDEEINVVDDGSALDSETKKFDTAVGVMEEVLMDPEFEEARESFCRANCSHFEDSDENKLVYTDVFHQYTHLIESTIEKRLEAAVPGFSMQQFFELLEAHKEELMSEVFDLLLSMGDFETFKELMLSYKKEAHEGSPFSISCTAMKIHTEEQEDGEERPDLDFGLCVTSVHK